MGRSARQRLVGLRSWESLTGSKLAGWVKLPPWFVQKEGAIPIAVVWRMSAIGIWDMATDPDDVRFQGKTVSSRPTTKMTRLTHNGLWPPARETTRVWAICGHEQSRARQYRVPSSAFMQPRERRCYFSLGFAASLANRSARNRS